MDPRLFESLEWRSIGPHRAGRVVAVAGHPTDKATFYFGACAGGVWKTTNGGSHWRNISDGYFNTASIGALAVAPSDPNVIYAGTGEVTFRTDSTTGDGVYKTTDGGRTWQHMGLTETRQIGDIVIHPDDADTVYVAAHGSVFGNNEERGVYRTTNGGETWEQVLYKNDRAGAVDLAMDLNNPRIIFASFFHLRRYHHVLETGVDEDCGLWRSLDGGDSWEDITGADGLPEGPLGRIGIATSPARSGRIWAIIEAEDGAVFRSDDYGESWIRLADDPAMRTRPWYYMHLIADPSDADTVWNMNNLCWKSIDGGATFSKVATPHSDNHALWIDPEDSNRLIQGNDGGACVSFDGGQTWSSLLNQPTAQFYNVETDHRKPYNVYGSQQDNWAMMVPSIGFEGAIVWKDYVEPGGGESGHIAISPAPPYTVYGGGIGTGPGDGRLLAWNPETRQTRNVTVWPEIFGVDRTLQKYRFQWTFPIEISPHDPKTVYVCSQYVHRSTDEGGSWEIISPDLTRSDPSKLGITGGHVTPEGGAHEMYCTIFTFSESPHRPGLFWAGTDDGLAHISRDGGESWTEITPPALKTAEMEWSKINMIELSPHDEATAYMAVLRYMHGDPSPYLYKTNDYGATWTEIVNGIPADDFTRTIREDPNRRGLLYVSTESGIHVSFDDGENWQRLGSGENGKLPVVPVYDIVVDGTDLVAGTHGRSFWILDDISPLRQMTEETAAEPFHLFAPRDTVRYKMYPGRMGDLKDPRPQTNYLMVGPQTVAYDPVKTTMGAYQAKFIDAGANPPDGVIVHYWLKEEPSGEVRVTFFDSSGNEVRSFTSASEEAPWVPAAAGANRLVWDLRYTQATELDGGGSLPGNLPPKAIPGEYRVDLTVDGETQSQPFTILPDPRLPVTVDDLKAQFELKLGIRDKVSEINDAVNTSRRVKRQIGEVLGREGITDEVREAGESLSERLTDSEKPLVLMDSAAARRYPATLDGKLTTLSVMLDESDHAPTAQMGEVFASVSERVDDALEDLQAILGEDIVSFNALVVSSGLPIVG